MIDPIGPTGNFGNLAIDYEQGRKDYPPAVIEEIHTRITDRPATVLDLGCGTGKSTRQLAANGLMIIGADPDSACLAQAMEAGGQNLAYRHAFAENLPFEDAIFSAVTTFSSFHWWWQVPGALDSVYRVLKPNAPFLIINKEDTGPFRFEVRDIIQQITGRPLKDARSNYDPVAILTEDSRWKTESNTYPWTETFDRDQLLQQIRSMSAWNSLIEEQREIAEDAMKEHFDSRLTDGLYHRTIAVKVVTGTPLP